MKFLKFLLFPFALIYDLITSLRNYCYDKGIFASESYDFPVIGVGNLSVGGTGKSPMVEYLIRLIQHKKEVGTLSRGYGRKSKGFRFVENDDSADMAGDEPLQFKTKFPEVSIAVDANRQNGIAELKKHGAEVIILDDVFQHRKVKPGFLILLTSYGKLFSEDYLLPVGRLRESRSGKGRADVIIVTKCPAGMKEEDRTRIIQSLDPESHQKVYFSTISYSDSVKNETDQISVESLNTGIFTLVTGIANPRPLVTFLNAYGLKYRHIKFPDHHDFREKEINKLKRYGKIITTEKDFMRLKNRIPSKDLYYLPIQMKFLWETEEFEKKVLNFVEK